MRRPEIIYIERFAPEADQLFKHLVTSVAWDEHMRARKTASFGAPYDYSQMSYPAVAMPETLGALANAIGGSVGGRPNNCLLNFYPDGEASMGFHSDSSEGLAPDSGVSIVSLGSPRCIVFRLKADRSVEHAIELAPGSLLHMPSAIQSEWLHAIPRAPGAGARISATFREISK